MDAGNVFKTTVDIALFCIMLATNTIAQGTGKDEQKKHILPVTYPSMYDTYPMQLCYVPSFVPRSISISKSQTAENVAEEFTQPDNRQRCPSFTYGGTRRGRFNCRTVNIERYITERDLFSIAAQRTSKWNRYHLANVYIDTLPVIRLRLQNRKKESLLANDRRALLNIERTGDGGCIISLDCYIRTPELRVIQQISITIDAVAAKPLQICDGTACCRHATGLLNGNYHMGECSGGSYDNIMTNGVFKTAHHTLYVVQHLLLTLNDGRETNLLYTILYNTDHRTLVAAKRDVIWQKGRFAFSDEPMELYDRPITTINPVNVFFQITESGQMPRLHPHHSGVINIQYDGSYEVLVLPFGTLERPLNVLNEVHYILNGVERPLVAPHLMSKNGLNLLAEDSPSYVVVQDINNENLDIRVVYVVKVPGKSTPEPIRLRFKVSNGHINLIASMRQDHGIPNRSTVCIEPVPLGKKALCIVHRLIVPGMPEKYSRLYTFLYDTEMRQLTAIVHDIGTSTDYNDVFLSPPAEAFVKPALYANVTNITISEKGEYHMNKPFAGYVSHNHMSLKTRAIVIPKGMGKLDTKYTDRFLFQDVTILFLCIEAEDGTSLIDPNLLPDLHIQSRVNEHVVRITYDIVLPGTSNSQPITVEFVCRTLQTRNNVKRVEITLSSKYQRIKTDGDQCVLDASVWNDSNETFGGKCRVGTGEKGAYVLVSRIIRNSGSADQGVLYKFLYDCEHSILFAKSVPVELVKADKGKACRWVRKADDINYDYSIGGIATASHEVSPMTQ
ncbi:uncharacterized protein BXIN_0956 [Babesia sp. Xinjiang]|uniref:uncharacterized protein n=1 Tax=Babesia sp. Xinjiang TaxID=462227 RepID=UPI000A249794|nr:uncharacterized protein BXIN_0956 [Babesia sp. Xinjiang]ORM42080.1 hypothetical protein BXIN_0956 [Babesia sp. Xinjiang]